MSKGKMKKIDVNNDVWDQLHNLRKELKYKKWSATIQWLLNHQSLQGETTQEIDHEKLLQDLVGEETWSQLQGLMSSHTFDLQAAMRYLISCYRLISQEKSSQKPESKEILGEIYDHIQKLKPPQEHNHVNDISPEKQAFLLDDLSKQYENPTGQDHKSESFKNQKDNMPSGFEDVNEKTAKKVNVSDIDEKKEFICCPLCWNIVPLVVKLDKDGNPLKKHEDGIEYKMVDGVLQRRFSGPGDDYLPFQIQTGGKVIVEDSMAISTLRRLNKKLYDDIQKTLGHANFLFGGR